MATAMGNGTPGPLTKSHSIAAAASLRRRIPPFLSRDKASLLDLTTYARKLNTILRLPNKDQWLTVPIPN